MNPGMCGGPPLKNNARTDGDEAITASVIATPNLRMNKSLISDAAIPANVVNKKLYA
jgi:hypothetical protein